MTTSNEAVDTKDADKASSEKSSAEKNKVHEKLAEKRRALGRGLESLLPGPREVRSQDSRSQASGVRSQEGGAAPSSAPVAPSDGGQPRAAVATPSGGETVAFADGGRTNASAATHDVVDLQASAAEGEFTVELGLDQIERNPYQTRTEFEQSALNDLAISIRVQGVLQPIVVRPATYAPGAMGMTGKGEPIVRWETVGSVLQPLVPVPEGGKPRYVLILGERRYRASKMAGKTTIPAIVRRVSLQQAAEMTLVENLQRQDLDCLDQASAFAKLSTQFKMTQEDIGKRVGVSREQVSNYLRLLKLPVEVQAALQKKELTYSHARLLLALDGDDQIVKVARLVIAKKMSVALLQELVLDGLRPDSPPMDPKPGGARWVDPNVRAEQRRLEAVLGVKVRIRDRQGKGRITIEYTTLQDFDRVVTMLKGKVVAGS